MISREAEHDLPSFDSYETARDYFKERFGEVFIWMDTELVNGQTVHFHALLLNQKAFKEGQEQLADRGQIVDALTFLNSYQPIELFEDGRVHIIH